MDSSKRDDLRLAPGERVDPLNTVKERIYSSLSRSCVRSRRCSGTVVCIHLQSSCSRRLRGKYLHILSICLIEQRYCALNNRISTANDFLERVLTLKREDNPCDFCNGTRHDPEIGVTNGSVASGDFGYGAVKFANGCREPSCGFSKFSVVVRRAAREQCKVGAVARQRVLKSCDV